MTERTSLMRAIAAEHGVELPCLVRQLLDEHGVAGACEYLGIGKSTMGYWMDRFGLRIAYVAVPPGYDVIIRPAEVC